MKAIVSWFAENHVAANLLMLFFIVAGLATAVSIKLEVFPETSLDQIVVSVAYPGASPEEVEEAIVRRIEENISGLTGVKEIRSVSRESLGQVTIEVESGWELKTLLDDVKSEVDRITTFPDEAERPVVTEVTQRSQVINVAVFGDVAESTLKNLTEKIKDEITNLPDVSLAETFGLREGEIHIEIPEESLRRHGLTLGQVAQIVAASSLDLPAGSVDTTGGEILIRGKGRRYWASDYLDVAVLTKPDGSSITLGQLAELKEGFADTDLHFRFNDRPAGAIQVFRVADQNALTVASQVKNYLEDVRSTLPAGVGIDYYQDMSEILESRISLLLRNMAFGLFLVSVLLWFFLDGRLAFWVSLGIPLSFLFAMVWLPGLDVSINMISLFAFITVLGIVVDDAIIIGENIYRKREEGFKPFQASIAGAYEVGAPVVFSVLTTIVAFLPLLLAGGMMGKIMRNIPIVVTFVLLGSLVESLLILPSHLAGSRAFEKKKKEKLLSRRLKAFVAGPYAKAVESAVRWRYATVAAAVAIMLLVVGTFTYGILKFTFFPTIEGNVLACAVAMPPGTPSHRTAEVLSRLERTGREAMDEIDRLERPDAEEPLFLQSASLLGLQLAGGPGGGAEVGEHLGQVWVVVLEGEKRDVSAARLTALWREKMGPVPDAEKISYTADLFTAGAAIAINLSMDDNETLLRAVEDLKAEISEFPGTYEVSDSFEPGKMEMRFKLEPAARTLGITLSDLATQVRHGFFGAEALRFLRDRDEIKVMVRLPDDQRNSLGFVEDFRIRTPQGQYVPFNQVAGVEIEQGYAAITRTQRQRVVSVTASVDESLGNANDIRQAVMNDVMPLLKEKYPDLRYTLEGEGKEQKESLTDVFKGFLVALFCIYALLAVPFRSFSQPFIVMSAIPFGLVGALIGHLIMGYNITLISLFGMVGLAGVVVNDSLVLIHAANRLRNQGEHPFDAITQAAQIRFRAILLTSVTTFAGLGPMILETSLQARFLIPMAISLGFGVMLATFVTLLLIPCGYMILHDIKVVFANILGRPSLTEQAKTDSII